ncbi:HEPN domain-containing protein [Methylobacterium aerolatum]|uniref:Nucleotidyltransferase/HEPN domain-containing protein n=1 Tax=Methylobacterium aerolatum TaxID=418708 RepID=A0ABU0I416_9HYPH|nr:HEPN domain-containing protein [Methylobacterium aerolatum]MDQ0449358.1 putative nucleotidyltransferase/HEPN domain-containing protein [Methylobacterium aerolatum]GJD36693.1 hypothetical protein FMGBMHLM_3616 [Methylobacterium aerolatum]
MIADRLSHLPRRKHRDLKRALQILFEEFEDFQKNKTTDKAKRGRIVKMILYGSYARGGWVENRSSGYFSDYDLLIVVDHESLVEESEIWDAVRDRIAQDIFLKPTFYPEVSFIIHSYADLNDQLARGRPFFADIAREGIVLYEATGYPLATAGLLTPEVRREEEWLHFDTWFAGAENRFFLARVAIAHGMTKEAAFELHQVAEQLYHCTMLVLTLYSPKLHALRRLRRMAEGLDLRLVEAWPRRTHMERKPFNLLHDAYVKARYSRHYAITRDELDWLVERLTVLQRIVSDICTERLGPQPPSVSPDQ